MSILVIKNAKVTRKGSDLFITWKNKSLTVSTLDLELIVIIGSNVEIDTGSILFLSSLNIPVLIHGKNSDVVLVKPYLNSLVEVRRKFYTLSDSMKLLLAKEFIQGKILGMVSVAKYFSYLTKIDVNTLDVKGIDKANNVDELRIIEAELSKKAWDELKKFLPESFPGRKPRNPDEVNRALDYAYSLIYALSTHALIAAGLDPYAGFMHSEQPGRTALTYDFSEMFKPVAIHSVIAVSRRRRLTLDSSGYLSKDSATIITKHLYQLLHKGKKTVRRAIYRKANEVKDFVGKGIYFEPYVYRPKAS